MSKEENTTPESQPEGDGAKDVETSKPVDNPADDKGAVIDPANKDAEEDTTPQGDEKNAGGDSKEDILERLNKELGKKFPDLDTAIKSIKDTTSYVGKRQDDAVSEAQKALEESGEYLRKSDYEAQRFFDKNPNLEPHKGVLEAVAKDKNISLAEAAKDESVSSLIEKAGKYDESESAKSVLETNPKLKESNDKFDEARSDLKDGRVVEAQDKAVKAVIGSMTSDQ